MSIWESEYTVDILNDLNKLKKLLRLDSIDDFGNMYFESQLSRYYYALYFIYKYLPIGKVLDVGNYPCHLHKILLEKGYEIDGIDIRPERIPDRLSDCRDRTYVWDLENESPNETLKNNYDAVIVLEVIEHLHVNPLKFLSSLGDVVKMDGLVLLSTPNLFALNNRMKFLFGKQTFEHPFSVYEQLDRHGSRGHQRIYSINELKDMFEVYGFDIIDTWTIDNKPPLLSNKKYRDKLDKNFDYGFFKSFWKENRSIQGRIRRKAEIIMNGLFENYYENHYIIAKRTGSFSEKKFFEKIAESDPWIDMNKYDLQV